jgi:hypothetical protein
MVMVLNERAGEKPYPAGVEDAPLPSSSPTPSSIPPPVIYDDAALLAYASWKEGKSNAGDFETFKTNYLACTIENVKAKSKVMVLNERAGEKAYPAGVEDAPPAPSTKTTPPIVEASEAVAEASAELDEVEETEDMKEVRRLLLSTPEVKETVVSDVAAPSPTTPMEAVVEASEAMAEASEALAEGFDALEEEEEKLMKEVRRQRRRLRTTTLSTPFPRTFSPFLTTVLSRHSLEPILWTSSRR